MRANLWSIVLAAGAGKRLSGITGGIPKQFWRIEGGRTLLEETLARSRPLAPPERTVIVVDQTHAPFIRALTSPVSASYRVVYQPSDRGTAAGVLIGLTEVLAADPHAVLLLTPSDHGVARPDYFAEGVREASAAVKSGASDVVLLGVAASVAEGDYGWIQPSPAPPPSAQLRLVGRFVEKPAPRVAAALFASRAVWNTMVLVGRAAALASLYRRHLPDVSEVFEHAIDVAAAERPAFLRRRYDGVARADFSRDLLGRAEGLSVYTWPTSMGWSDLGTPERLERWLNDAPRRAARMPPGRPSTAQPVMEARHG